MPPLLELSKWPPGLATRPTRVSAQTRGHGRGPPAIFLADLGQPRASCLRPPPAAPAPRGLGALLVTKGVGPGSARVYTKCECLKWILALLGLVPHCGTQVCAGDSLFFSPETRGAGTGPRPSGAGCASPGGGARRWLLRASDSRGKPTGGCPGVQKAASETGTVTAAIYLGPTVCYTSRSAPALPNCITKHHKPVSVLLMPFHRALRVCVSHWIWA